MRMPPNAKVVTDGRLKLGTIAIGTGKVFAWSVTGKSIGEFASSAEALSALKREAVLEGARAQ